MWSDTCTQLGQSINTNFLSFIHALKVQHSVKHNDKDQWQKYHTYILNQIKTISQTLTSMGVTIYCESHREASVKLFRIWTCVLWYSYTIKYHLAQYWNELFHKKCINDWQYVQASKKKPPKSELKVTIISSSNGKMSVPLIILLLKELIRKNFVISMYRDT